MKIRVIISFFLCCALTSCFDGRAFRPPPPEYSVWKKNGKTEEEVKQEMRDCGYINLYGYGIYGKGTIDDSARRENCMFNKGYKYEDGYKGICGTKNSNAVLACQETGPNK